jgi:hypothetical protein
MEDLGGFWHFLAAACLVVSAGCRASPTTHPDQASGGQSGPGSGGTPAGSGGTASAGTGGAPATGGTSATGGTTGGGGTSARGGSPGSGGNAAGGGGGAPAAGGSAPGGRAGAGGVTSGAGGLTGAVGGATSSSGGSGAGGQAGTADAGSSSAISGLKIDANPKSVLSCFVSWTTSEPATSVVQFGAGKYEWEIADATQATSHKVLVIGMHAAQAYLIKAISVGPNGAASAEGTFTTGALPVNIPVATISAVDATKMQPGWTLMNIQKGDGTATAKSKYPAAAVMYDEGGQPVWYYVDGTSVDRGGAIPTELTDQGVLIGATLDDSVSNAQPPREVDFAGNTLWECPNPGCTTTGTTNTGNLTHHATKLPNGHIILNRDVTVGGVTAPVFEEISTDNKIVWTLDYRKFVTPPAGASGDWCHGNSITVDIDKNEVYANCRFVGLIKTTYQNPSLLWHLPAAFNGKGLGNLTFSPTTSQFSDTHDPEIHDDGTVLFFDNGGYDGVIGEEGNPKGYHSRAVEYQIDESKKTATLVWEFPGNFNVDAWYKTSFYLPFWGDADRLANGNVLVTAGVRGTTVQSRVFEVTKQDGKVVWEFKLPMDFGVYRSERITPPLVKAVQ